MRLPLSRARSDRGGSTISTRSSRTPTTARSGSTCATGFRIRTRNAPAREFLRASADAAARDAVRHRRRRRGGRRDRVRDDAPMSSACRPRSATGSASRSGDGASRPKPSRPSPGTRSRRTGSRACSRCRSRANAASCRVLEKAGYVLEGRLRRSAIKDGQIIDQLQYAFTAAAAEARREERRRSVRRGLCELFGGVHFKPAEAAVRARRR